MATSHEILTQKINSALAELTADIKSNTLELPSPPALLIELRAMVNDEESSANDIAVLIKHDQNISGRLIKVANSSLFSSRHHVTTSKAAVSRLGLSKVQNLVIGLLIAQNFIKNRIKGLESYFHNSWQQSNNVAAIAYVLAKRKTKLDPEQALLAGMVHNIGVLPLLLRLNKISVFKDNPKLLLHVADIVVPKLYPNAGQLILSNWNFSSTISQTVLTHNKIDFDSPDEINLNDIIFLAYNLNKIETMTDEKCIPDKLVSSSIFRKLWSNESDAFHDLTELDSDISQMKQDMTN